jgi:hypothetical protein
MKVICFNPTKTNRIDKIVLAKFKKTKEMLLIKQIKIRIKSIKI